MRTTQTVLVVMCLLAALVTSQKPPSKTAKKSAPAPQQAPAQTGSFNEKNPTNLSVAEIKKFYGQFDQFNKDARETIDRWENAVKVGDAMNQYIQERLVTMKGLVNSVAGDSKASAEVHSHVSKLLSGAMGAKKGKARRLAKTSVDDMLANANSLMNEANDEMSMTDTPKEDHSRRTSALTDKADKLEKKAVKKTNKLQKESHALKKESEKQHLKKAEKSAKKAKKSAKKAKKDIKAKKSVKKAKKEVKKAKTHLKKSKKHLKKHKEAKKAKTAKKAKKVAKKAKKVHKKAKKAAKKVKKAKKVAKKAKKAKKVAKKAKKAKKVAKKAKKAKKTAAKPSGKHVKIVHSKNPNAFRANLKIIQNLIATSEKNNFNVKRSAARTQQVKTIWAATDKDLNEALKNKYQLLKMVRSLRVQAQSIFGKLEKGLETVTATQ